MRQRTLPSEFIGSGCGALAPPTPDVALGLEVARSGRPVAASPGHVLVVGLSSGPSRGSSSPTATSRTSCQGAFRYREDPGSPPHPLRRLRRSGRIRRTVPHVPTIAGCSWVRSLPLLELLVLSFGFPLFRCRPERPLPLCSLHHFWCCGLGFGEGMPLPSLVPSSWVLTTSTGSSVRASRRVAAGTGSGVRQVGPASFVDPLVLRRGRSVSDRARGFPWRDTLRRFRPRRQPSRITAGCSPPAVRRLPFRGLSPLSQ